MGSPSGLETVLGRADGTVTALLEQLVGEPIDARARDHRTVEATDGNHLRVAVGHPLLGRAADLVGRRSGRAYVFAVSVLVPSRLPDRFGPRLQEGHRPIGRMLEAEGIEVVREPLAGPGPEAGAMATGAGPPDRRVLLARTYRLHAGGPPLMEINEWFLDALRPHLPPG